MPLPKPFYVANYDAQRHTQHRIEMLAAPYCECGSSRPFAVAFILAENERRRQLVAQRLGSRIHVDLWTLL
jgi:hypothetical protein